MPRPGEITLAHHGVLFLDELTEFQRSTLDVLREPMEAGEIHIARAARQSRFPARFQLIAAMNPTPGGYGADDARSQRYSPDQLRRYLSRLSGPFLDRLDLYVEVPAVPPEVLQARSPGEPTETVQARVQAAWARQIARQGCRNHELNSSRLADMGVMAKEERDQLIGLSRKLKLSARAQHRIERVALTLVDLEQADRIGKAHLMEAINLRQLDRLGLGSA
ncbi:MAG: ATP-binding protein [Natronospirillum sp.]|uniref:ATP-binding protein n=1 Tax=Natronospirillum sp. TaxID=2812955 RepID=UPI0025CF33B6|nr:ATP-binding protein [Natronospirillum sp.]MCH8551984.1 ATP-binding protein [Natronospirillum sp.]